MKKLLTLLVVLAAVQLVLVVTTYKGNEQLQGRAQTSTLLSFNGSEIDQIRILGDEGEAILEKKNGSWQTAPDFPADQDKVQALLDTLGGLEYGLPVATSSSGLSRFKLAADQYVRRIRLYKGEQVVAELYLGTGAGARRTHGRSGDQQAVYTVAMGVYDAPCTPGDWQDKDILQLEKDSITRLTLDGVTCTRSETGGEETDTTGKQWLAELDAGKTLNQSGIENGVQAIATLRFTRVLGREEKQEYGLAVPVRVFSLVHGEEKREYTIGQLQESEEYVVKVSDRPEYFLLSSYTGKALVEAVSMDAWVQGGEVESDGDTLPEEE